MKGYMGKILRVNLSNREIFAQDFSEDLARLYIGGSGLGSRFLFDETNEKTDPFGENNVLMFLTGPLVGTTVPCSGRHAVIAKSALGIWGEGDVGGSWGVYLKRAGYDGIIIKGKSEKPVYLWVTEEKISIKDASHIWGKDTYEVEGIIKTETNEKAVISCIGPAGEKMSRMAVIFNNGIHARAAGRGGLGAVMGSKNLKAIAVYGRKKVEVAYPDKVRSLTKESAAKIIERQKRLREFGTPGGVVGKHKIGDMPIKNWSLGRWDDEKINKISGQTMADTILKGRYSCASCVIGCGRVVKVDDGPFAGVNGGGPEYEACGSLGSMCLIDDLKAIAMGNELCNRYGIDVISAGSAVAFAMECYEKGLITQVDTGGIKLEWGNAKAMVAMIHKIGKREGLGRLLGEGVRIAARKIGGNSSDFAVEVKGLEPPMHDARALGSFGVAYPTYPRGACHRGCNHYIERKPFPEFGLDEPIDPREHKGKGIGVAIMQDYAGLFNSLKLCQFILNVVRPPQILEFLNYVTGWRLDFEELMQIGERAQNVKRMYNVRLGLSKKDDTLPKRMKEKLTEGGAANYSPDTETMLKEYYKYRGWSKQGVPLLPKLRELGLSKESEIVKKMDSSMLEEFE